MTAHYNGENFHNPWLKNRKSFGDFLKWQWQRERASWPEWLNALPGPPPLPVVGKGDVRFTAINHATVLIQTDEMNILTDPIWSDRCSPWSWLGPKRVRPPGITFEDLPQIHMVVLSHNHYDHMDLPTLKRLNDRFHPLFLVGLGNSKTLTNFGIDRVVELDWWQSYDTAQSKIHFVPAQHFSSRSLWDQNRSLWGGFVIEASMGEIYFAGDTGYGPHFAEIASRFTNIQISFLPIGAYEPRWFMQAMHVNPEEAIQAHLDLKSQLSVGIHFGTFQLTDEGIDAPVKELKRALEKPGREGVKFLVPEFGQAY
ncbi:MAG: MBL fold metallo-hydrolase [Bdellovibrionaceae bacterium]|nr:MBL fold metallo-hydrolase [Pseudobdellovibrionaceae bacterium]